MSGARAASLKNTIPFNPLKCPAKLILLLSPLYRVPRMVVTVTVVVRVRR